MDIGTKSSFLISISDMAGYSFQHFYFVWYYHSLSVDATNNCDVI